MMSVPVPTAAVFRDVLLSDVPAVVGVDRADVSLYIHRTENGQKNAHNEQQIVFHDGLLKNKTALQISYPERCRGLRQALPWD